MKKTESEPEDRPVPPRGSSWHGKGMCVNVHLDPKPATYNSPTDFCDECWREWFTAGWPS